MNRQSTVKAKLSEAVRRSAGRHAQAAGLVGLLLTLHAFAQDSGTQWGADDNAAVLYVHYVRLTAQNPLILDISTQRHHYAVGIRPVDGKEELFIEVDGASRCQEETVAKKGTNVFATIKLREGKVEVGTDNRNTRDSIHLTVDDDSEALFKQVIHPPPVGAIKGGNAIIRKPITKLFKEEMTRWIFE
jgi:hypothetical protein